MYIFSNRHNPYICSLASGVRTTVVGKAKWKSLELPLFRKIGRLKMVEE